MTEIELTKKKLDLLERMRLYLTEFGGEGYSVGDVQKVGKTLEVYFHNIKKKAKKKNADYLSDVKKAVIDLNKLNEKCEGSLIETDQREDICAFLINTAMSFGFIEKFEDITEEWRDW